ncbi:L,D-transpeptidase family protein [Erythrobacter sp. F6033]|uniref:L,D-transpeptidase family protein n=1 Tax=Erythrobacter sp. F6033 TaxID=2926401 RepID=UPI001FF688C2|nr:L,D-transpeptidase family protein [Erythrobacter sp. F6033]MCK0129192.1 L,D-transpeptidase family protein [Erythrobacter sp. F6033]
MKQIALHARITAALALTALSAQSALADNQATPDDAADAAEQVAQEAQNEIRRIDPTTGGQSLVVDPSLPAPYGADIAATEAPELSVSELPELPPAATVAPVATAPVAVTPAISMPAPTIATPTVALPSAAPPRGPAARMIAEPIVQTAPAYDADDPFVVKSILPIEGTIRYGEWYWDESNAPKTGKLVMTVDLDARVISVFRDGHEIGTAVALLGTQKHPTPIGTFPILTKEKDNISEKYNNAPMPWTLRLTWDGIAIHGSPVLNGYASHGCIGVPDPFAEKLFEIAKRGDRVVITRGSLIGIGDKISG